MAKGPYPSDRQDQYMLRFPAGMRDRLKEIAAVEGRSLNAEIIERLRKSLSAWPQVELPDELAAEALEKLPSGTLDPIMDEIKSFAVERLGRAIRDHDLSQKNLVVMLEEVIDYAPEDERARLRGELRTMLQRAGLVGGPELDEWPYK